MNGTRSADWRTWMIGAMFAVVIMLVGIIAASNGQTLDRLASSQDKLTNNNDRIVSIQATQGERIAGLEAELRAMRIQLTSLQVSIDRLTTRSVP